MSLSDMKTITVIGSGLIGRSWAMLFVSGGYSVKIYDNQPEQAEKAITDIRKQLEELEKAHMLRGELTAAQQIALVSSCSDMALALEGAFFIQECVFEKLEVKQDVFQDIERHVGEDVILSSSTSNLVPSSIFSKVHHRSRCLVSHPVSAATGGVTPPVALLCETGGAGASPRDRSGCDGHHLRCNDQGWPSTCPSEEGDRWLRPQQSPGGHYRRVLEAGPGWRYLSQGHRPGDVRGVRNALRLYWSHGNHAPQRTRRSGRLHETIWREHSEGPDLLWTCAGVLRQPSRGDRE